MSLRMDQATQNVHTGANKLKGAAEAMSRAAKALAMLGEVDERNKKGKGKKEMEAKKPVRKVRNRSRSIGRGGKGRGTARGWRWR